MRRNPVAQALAWSLAAVACLIGFIAACAALAHGQGPVTTVFLACGGFAAFIGMGVCAGMSAVTVSDM